MTKALIVVALLLSGCVAASARNALGQDKGQQPAQKVLEADKGITLQLNCIDEQDQTIRQYGHLLREIKLTNKCEQRLKCNVYAAAYGPQGPQLGRTVMILAARSVGAGATQSFRFRIKEESGTLTSTRHCKVF
jgi:hypothetical protein